MAGHTSFTIDPPGCEGSDLHVNEALGYGALENGIKS